MKDRERVRGKGFILVLSSIVVLILLSLSPLVFASWTEDSSSGEWTIKTRINWSATNTMMGGEVQYSLDDDIDSFEGYYTSVFFTELKAEKMYWYSLQTNKRVILLWNFSELYVYVNFLEQHNLFGWVHDRWVQVGVSTNSTDFTTSADFWWNPFGIQTERDDFRNYPTTLDVYVDKVSDTEVEVVVLNCRDDTSHDVLMWNQTIEVGSSWFSNNVSATFNIYHEGKGYLTGGMNDEIFTEAWEGHTGDTEDIAGFGIFDFIDNLLGGAIRSLPVWLQEYIAMMGSWISQFTVILAPLWGNVTLIIPLLPILLVFWVLDAGMTSINEGSVQPVGLVFTTIFNTATRIINLLIDGFHAIYDFIHFW